MAELSFPSQWSEADVVGIYKKGDAFDPANYRPISLLNALYKLFSAIIASRLMKWAGGVLRDTQYGFRGARSTGDPLHLVHRAQELIEEREHQTLHLIFLDWE
eukprot:15460830-Alexandrium_andersonii.AAC.1